MNDPWFNPNHWGWMPGTLLGCLCGLWGGLAGTLVPRRRGKALVLGLGWLIAALTAGTAAAGLTALMTGQPYGVWFTLLLPTAPLAVMVLAWLPLLPRYYRQPPAVGADGEPAPANPWPPEGGAS